MEYKLDMDSTEYTWYPFRYLFAETSTSGCVCPAGTLEYRCNSRGGDLITEYKHQNFNIEYAKYIFPKPSNARYKFGENQRVEMQYLSDAGKLWTQVIYVNVRPYTDARNPDCSSYSNATTYNKNVSAVSLDVKVEKYAYENTSASLIKSVALDNFGDSWNWFDENGELKDIPYRCSKNIKNTDTDKVHYFTYRNIPILNPVLVAEDGTKMVGDGTSVAPTQQLVKVVKLKSADFFSRYYEFYEYLRDCTYEDSSGTLHHEIHYNDNNNNTVIVDNIFGDSVCGNFASLESLTPSQYKESSAVGYIYWGDGTFDIYSFSNYCATTRSIFEESDLKTYRNCTYANGKKGQVVCYPIFGNVSGNSTLVCGRKIENEAIVFDYETDTMIARAHEYIDIEDFYKIYTISITCSASYIENDDYGTVLSIDCKDDKDNFMRQVNNSNIKSWCDLHTAYASQSDLLSLVDKSYYYYNRDDGGDDYELRGIEQGNGEQLRDGAVLAYYQELDRGDYYRPARQTYDMFAGNKTIEGFNAMSILRKIAFGDCLIYRKNYTSANCINKTYLDLTYDNISMFLHDVKIDLNSILNVNISHTASLNTVIYKYDYLQLDQKLNFGSDYVTNKMYYNPADRGWSDKEKKFYGDGVSDKAALILEGVLPHNPVKLSAVNFNAIAREYKDENTNKSYYIVSRSSYYPETSVCVVCSDKTVSLYLLYTDRYPTIEY